MEFGKLPRARKAVAGKPGYPVADEAKPILIGRIAGVYGIKGWVKIVSYTRPIEQILAYSPWYIQRPGALQALIVREKAAGKSLRVALEGITDRDLARELVGSDIYIKRHQLEDLPEGQYYWADLIGLQVVNTDSRILGILEDIYETGANDVLVVQGGGQRHLIPLVWERYLLDVDLEQGIIRVDWEQTE